MADIDHVVVLMLENRSFDHMLGWPAVQGTRVPFDPGNLAGGYAPVFELTGADAYRTTPDPLHDFADVTLQIFGQRAPGAGMPATNDGFVLSYSQSRDEHGRAIGPARGKNILGCLSPGVLPVLRTLAQEFVVCDSWFASVPGPTWPNRDFIHSGTSMGHADNPSQLEIVWGYPNVRTIYDNLTDAHRSWKVYYHDIPQVFWFRDLVQYKETNFALFDEFAVDVQRGALPAYSFIEPRYFNSLAHGANDQHPPHDVGEGERLITAVYDALRRDDAVWRRLLLVLVYDEHGGFYDHVPPPAAVNPDGRESASPAFKFDRLGVRVPALLVSPWVGKGQVDHTVYDHTSVLAFLKRHFGLPDYLHRRDAAAQSFERNFLATPRDDTPTSLSAGITTALRAAPAAAARRALGGTRLSGHQRRLVALAAALEQPQVQHEAARYVVRQVGRVRGTAPRPAARRPGRPRLRSTTTTTSPPPATRKKKTKTKRKRAR